MNAIPGQKLLGDKPGYFTIDGHANDIEERVLKHQRQAQGDNHARCVSGTSRSRMFKRRSLDACRVKGITRSRNR